MIVLDWLIHVVFKIVELIIAVSLALFVLDFFFGVDLVEMIRRRRAQKAQRARAQKRIRVSVPMVRDPDGRFVSRMPPELGDPHTPEEIAAAEAEVEAELRRGGKP